MRSALAAIQSTDWSRAIVEPEPSKRRYLPYDWRTRDVDHVALPSCGVTATLVLPRRFLEEQKLFLPQMHDEERVTLGDVCATLRDYEGVCGPVRVLTRDRECG